MSIMMLLIIEQSTSLIRHNLSPKYKEQGSPTISIMVGNSKFGTCFTRLRGECEFVAVLGVC